MTNEKAAVDSIALSVFGNMIGWGKKYKTQNSIPQKDLNNYSDADMKGVAGERVAYEFLLLQQMGRSWWDKAPGIGIKSYLDLTIGWWSLVFLIYTNHISKERDGNAVWLEMSDRKSEIQVTIFFSTCLWSNVGSKDFLVAKVWSVYEGRCSILQCVLCNDFCKAKNNTPRQWAWVQTS